MAHTESRPPSSEGAEPEDLTSGPQSLHRAVLARKAEYVRPHKIRIKVGTWNVAACTGTDKDLASWFGSSDSEDPGGASSSEATRGAAQQLAEENKIDLYVLGLQEAVELGPTQYLNRVVTEDPTKEKWKAAVETALPDGYQLISCEQMSGLLLVIYASPELAPTISDVSSCAIGTGMIMGWVGNKGAVTTRLVLGETTKIALVNCHLASGHDVAACERRVWDAGQILSRTKFAPISHGGVVEEEGDTINDQDLTFWFGDLNFRLDGLPGDDIRRLLMLHTRGEYDLSKKGDDTLPGGKEVVVQSSSESSDSATEFESATTSPFVIHSDDSSSISLPDPDDFDTDPHGDPASLQATLDSLLPHDQLKHVIDAHKVFHDGWREGSITFLPTYKYDVGTVSLFDSSEKRRAPSWCDRVLYRTKSDRERHEKKVKDAEEARRKDEEMKARGLEEASDDDQVLFDYDPDNDGDSQPQGQAVFDYDEYDEEEEENEAGEQAHTTEALPDRVSLDLYTSHQQIMSSDHKPITSIFSLDYDAVVPELKAKVHAEVAWELDRAENEGRPVVTLVVDGHESAAPGHAADKEFSSHAVDFGEAQFLKKQTATLTLANTGGVSATLSFVEKPSTEDPVEGKPAPWLTTSFSRFDEDIDVSELGNEVVLEPGETVRACLDVYIGDIPLVRMLNDGQESLEDVLVLRVTDGRDHFIPVRATWSPTCIGRSIDELIRVPNGGLKAFVASRSKENGHVGSIPYDLNVHFSAPKELFKLTEAVETLTERVLADELMLEEHQVPKDPGWPFSKSSWKYTDKEVRRSHSIRVIDVLDNDKPVVDAFDPETPSIERLEAVSEVLLLFLESLTDGIITIPLWARIEQVPLNALGQGNAAAKLSPEVAAEDDKAAIFDILTSAPTHNISFVFLTTTLAKIISELAPLSKSDLEALKTSSQGLGSLGRRSLAFRRSGATPAATEAAGALERRTARERRFAEVLGGIVCRAVVPTKDKERRALEDRQRAVIELFLKRREDG